MRNHQISFTDLILFYRRFKTTDVPSSVSKAAPDFCTVYVIAKGKISSVRSASSVPAKPPLRNHVQHQTSNISDSNETPSMRNQHFRGTYVSLILASCYFQPVCFGHHSQVLLWYYNTVADRSPYATPSERSHFTPRILPDEMEIR